MKLRILKYLNFKKLTVLFLLIAFNTVLIGRDLHNCICHSVKTETKKSCCKKETTREETNKKSCCNRDSDKSNSKKACDNCSSCKYEKGESKNDGLINSDKFVKTDVKKYEKSDYSIHNIMPGKFIGFSGDCFQGYGTRLFLSISCLRI